MEQTWRAIKCSKIFLKLNRWQTVKLYLHYLNAMPKTGLNSNNKLQQQRQKRPRCLCANVLSGSYAFQNVVVQVIL